MRKLNTFVKENQLKVNKSERRLKRKTKWDNLDFFAAPVDSFNFEGRRRIHSKFGLTCSIILYTFILTLILERFM
jgi:hypothetical protein